MRLLAILSVVVPLLTCSLIPELVGAQRSTLPGAQQRDSLVPITLEEALREARASNAQLPVAALAVDIAQTVVREGQASRFPRLGLSSGLNVGGPIAYTTPQGALQVVGSDTLFAGGLRRANIRAAKYRVQVAGAGYRVAQKDVDLYVRLRFSELLKATSEIAFREQGIERLRSYLSQIQARKAAAQPVGSDVLTTQVRLLTEEAALADARRAADEARLQLNDLMGREPATPLAAVPLPPPQPPVLDSGTAWFVTPDVRQAEASTAAAQTAIAATRAERKPELEVAATLGALPVFGPNAGTGPTSGAGFGGAVLFSLSLPLLDGGTYRARLTRAQMEANQARDSEIVLKRQVRLSYQLAAAQLTRLYSQVETWSRNVPIARDAYLETQSIYNGGAATALEVLDAYSSWINANESYVDAVLRYREAEANYLRWGTP